MLCNVRATIRHAAITSFSCLAAGRHRTSHKIIHQETHRVRRGGWVQLDGKERQEENNPTKSYTED